MKHFIKTWLELVISRRASAWQAYSVNQYTTAPQLWFRIKYQVQYEHIASRDIEKTFHVE